MYFGEQEVLVHIFFALQSMKTWITTMEDATFWILQEAVMDTTNNDF